MRMTNDSTPTPEPATPEPVRKSRAEAKAERRQALIDATITSIARHGLSGTTIARVTKIAGTSIGLANFHFASKEVLFEAVLQHLADEERGLWRARSGDPAVTPMDRLIGLVDARFDARSCDPQKLAVWFAFWGDAGARAIYRRVVEPLDEERLQAEVAIIASLDGGGGARDPLRTALGLEALYDGLWLNHLLYPDDFRLPDCRAQALAHLAALFPDPVNGPQTGAPGGPCMQRT